jgi:hypothetical protein
MASHLGGHLRHGLGKGPLQLLQPLLLAAPLGGQRLEFLPQALQIPLHRLERLALGGHLGFGGIAGAAPLAELGLQLALACLQGLALCLVGLLLLFPLLPLAHQRLNRRHEALFIAA